MGDQNTKDDPAATTEEPTTQDPPKDDPAATTEEPTDDELGEKGRETLRKLREEIRDQAKQLKELKPKADAHDAAEEAKKDQATKDAEALAAKDKRIAELELKELRRDVADAKKLPAALAARLSGETKEDLEADADKLLAELKELQGENGDDEREPKKKGAPVVQKTDKPQPTGLGAAVAARISPNK